MGMRHTPPSQLTYSFHYILPQGVFLSRRMFPHSRCCCKSANGLASFLSFYFKGRIMKRIILIIFCLVLISSCTPTHVSYPSGTWAGFTVSPDIPIDVRQKIGQVQPAKFQTWIEVYHQRLAYPPEYFSLDDLEDEQSIKH